MPIHTRIIDQFIKRLSAGASRSPLLRVRISRTGRLLDIADLAVVRRNLPRRLLDAVVEKQNAVSLTLRLPDEDEMEPDLLDLDEESKIQARLYDLLGRRIRRYGELAKRETGLHTVWLGYPLLYVHGDPRDTQQRILAPVFLWPINIELDLSREGRMHIGGLGEASVPRFNVMMSTWLRRTINFEAPVPDEDELAALNWDWLAEYMDNLTEGIQNCVGIDVRGDLMKIPALGQLPPGGSRRVYNAAVLGHMRWRYESLLADLRSMKSMRTIEGVGSVFVSGEQLDRPPRLNAPSEEDRFIVTEADYSQEQVIWQARNDPGLVVHGPPGTGKSQTIVNVIADSLAHGQTVLMVCQKQAATRVVMERMKGVGLDGLCMEVHDTESERMGVFRTVRSQTDRLNSNDQQSPTIRWNRSTIISTIERIEQQLDRHAQVLCNPSDKIGLSYRDVLRYDAIVRRSFPTARALSGLGELVKDLSSQESAELLGKIGMVGNLFIEALPLTNMWRYRKPSVHPSPGFISSLEDILGVVTKQDDVCNRKIVEIDAEFDRAEKLHVEEEAVLAGGIRALENAREGLGSVASGYNRLRAKLGRIESLCYAGVRPLAGLDQALDEVEEDVTNRLVKPDSFSEVLPELRLAGELQTEQMTRLNLEHADVDVRMEQIDAVGSDILTQMSANDLFPDRLAAFARDAESIIQEIEPLTTDTGNMLKTLLARLLKQGEELDLDKAELACAEAISLTGQLEDHPIDGWWEGFCSNMDKAALRDVGWHVNRVMRHRHDWFRWIIGDYLQSKGGLIRWRPELRGKEFWPQIESLQRYLLARELRLKLDSQIAELVPGFRIRIKDDQAREQYAPLVKKSLRVVRWLYTTQARHPWLKLVAGCLRFERTDEIRSILVGVRSSADRLERLRSVLQQWVFETQDTAGMYIETGGRVEAQRQLIEDALQTRLETERKKAQDHRIEVMAKLTETLSPLSTFLGREAFEEPEQLINAGESVRPWCGQVRSNADRLDALIAYNSYVDRLNADSKGVVEQLERYETQREEKEVGTPNPPRDLETGAYGQWWIALVKTALATGWMAFFHQECPDLLALNADRHQDLVDELAAALKAKRQLDIQGILSLWKGQAVGCRNVQWKRIFKMRGGRYGPATRLREAVELGIPQGLLKLRPCWLVGPDAAAKLLPLEQGLFDVVIFDEASQCPLEQALPAIYRGKRLLVSGDEKQLPPTSFFMANVTDESDAGRMEDEDAEATEQTVIQRRMRERSEEYLLEVDNLLDAAVDTLPEEYLRVHYRSQHPELVEFSNRAFYEGLLEMPPGRADTRDDVLPIEYDKVDGTYLPAPRRTNRKEAQRVVEILVRLSRESLERPTIGVVTFNKPQHDLIEQMIEEYCTKDRAFAAWYEREVTRKTGNQDVGLFVKNLENVQGDERDVMVFSTTFGPDASGRFARRFGPVGQTGGERRLNVAVTRAKQKVIVVSSIPINEVSTALSVGPGGALTPAGYLQLYLAYAEAIGNRDKERAKSVLDRFDLATGAVASRGEPESPFEDEVKEAIESLGYAVDAQVGESGFRIDLAIRNPEPGRGYVLGVECDGATFHSGWTARARDIWREQILRDRGWPMHRIWSTRWWHYQTEEVNKLRVAIEEAITESNGNV